jgi:hypothetical protein
MPRIEDVFHEAFTGCDRVILCADASGPLGADALAHLAEVVRRCGAQPGAVVFCDSSDDHIDGRARATAAFAAARTLAEPGRLAPFVVFDQARASEFASEEDTRDHAAPMLESLAGALDALIRLPALPASGPQIDKSAVMGQLLARGWATIGMSATRGTSAADLDAAAAHAFGSGLMTRAMPPPRAGAIICTVVGNGTELERTRSTPFTRAAPRRPAGAAHRRSVARFGFLGADHRVREASPSGDVRHAWASLIVQEWPCSAWRSAKRSRSARV